jgi:hypothetical protein
MARNRALSEDQIERARTALESGARMDDVAMRFHVSKQTLIRNGLRRKHYKASGKKSPKERFTFSLWGNRDPDKRTERVVMK